MGDAVQPFVMAADRLPDAVDALVGTVDEFVAPVRVPPGDIFFLPVRSSQEVAFDFSNSLISPVAVLYPPKEVLFEFRFTDEGRPKLSYELDRRSRIIFGIRPCDTAAVAYLDRFLGGGEFLDTHYLARRNNTKLVTLACAQPASDACWCSCSQAGPVAEEGYDIQLTPVGDRFLVEVAPGGTDMAQRWAEFLQPADETLLAERDVQVEATKQQLELNAHLGAAMRRVTAGAVDGLWEDVGSKCIGCGGCSVVCPKCTCFNVADELRADGSGRRVRSKDSCRLAGYSLEASGHNPRPTRADRARRWHYHKLSYRYMERNGYHGCVGCGRCVTVCMAGVDMPTVARRVREAARDAKLAGAAG